MLSIFTQNLKHFDELLVWLIDKRLVLIRMASLPYLIIKMRNEFLVGYVSLSFLVNMLENIFNLLKVEDDLILNLHEVLDELIENFECHFRSIFCFVFEINIVGTVHVSAQIAF